MTIRNLTDTERGALIAMLHTRGVIDVRNPKRGDYARLARSLGVHRSTARQDARRVRRALDSLREIEDAITHETK